VPNPFSVRAAGLASVTAGGLILLNQLSQLIFVYTVSESFWTGTHVYRRGLALIAMYVLLIALTALYSLEANVMGNLGLIGYLIAFLGTMLVAGDWWYETFIVPTLMEWSPELMDEPVSGSILIGAYTTSAAFAVGWLIFGFSSYRAAVFPRGGSILMMFGGLAGAVTLIDGSQIPLGIAVGWIGLWLIRSGSSKLQSVRASEDG
jgi:uncharacterized membrane protein (DUF485 family)